MNHSTIDCRAMFRLHTLDLMPPQQTNPHMHWMLRRNRRLRGLIADLAREYGRLRRVGGDPFDGAPITGCRVIQVLGLANRAEPHSFWGDVKATAAMLAAGSRASFRIGREVADLHHQRRSCL